MKSEQYLRYVAVLIIIYIIHAFSSTHPHPQPPPQISPFALDREWNSTKETIYLHASRKYNKNKREGGCIDRIMEGKEHTQRQGGWGCGVGVEGWGEGGWVRVTCTEDRLGTCVAFDPKLVLTCLPVFCPDLPCPLFHLPDLVSMALSCLALVLIPYINLCSCLNCFALS